MAGGAEQLQEGHCPSSPPHGYGPALVSYSLQSLTLVWVPVPKKENTERQQTKRTLYTVQKKQPDLTTCAKVEFFHY